MLDKIRAVQTAVGVESDGIPGTRTWNAIFSRICGEQVVQIVDSGWRADDRSERNIAGLQAPLQAIARAFLRECLSEGIEAKIICGLRTFKEQDALYNKGRGEMGRIVTYARGGQSWHNYGLAFDIGLFRGTDYIPTSPQYAAAGKIGGNLGLEWGGVWDRLPDEPHFQWRPKWAEGMRSADVLAEAHRRTLLGQSIC
jgi:peptidoglycan L-alanyl-D-glutamate endopeptidase CwlK